MGKLNWVGEIRFEAHAYGCLQALEAPLPSLLTRLLEGFSSLRAAEPRTSGTCRPLAGDISSLPHGPPTGQLDMEAGFPRSKKPRE